MHLPVLNKFLASFFSWDSSWQLGEFLVSSSLISSMVNLGSRVFKNGIRFGENAKVWTCTGTSYKNI